jgi:hypothetical protein
MTQREEELIEQLLTALARQLGRPGEELVGRTSIAQSSPTMLAAWGQARLLGSPAVGRRLAGP